ncbi:hypothetical protein ASG17_09805 [Brevundimonas sp. Leaf363]|uniref:hypothetical protein n=1 Tax=Brevundimonas sp. Leaf363 TaxID=1736353 RepID=UPI0006FAEC01|nr:hypothetical protein [Brevundimonas sp. Leaf363]KQS56289.1 hypothetical protein ASG17_09805 [Brevundimonas sp. Leaf363]
MRWIERFAFLHPIWLLVSLVGYFALSLAMAPMATTHAPVLIPAMAILGFTLPLLWITGLRALARQAMGMAPWNGWSWVYAAVPLASVVAAASLTTALEIAGAAIFGATIAYFTSIWLTARALAAYQRGPGAVALTIGTALLLVYYIIGAWVLRPVVRQLKAATSE